MRTMFENGKKKFQGYEKIPEATSGWDMIAMSRNANRRRRKNLSRLYDMEPVSESMYDLIMRADEGRATPDEKMLIDQFIKDKMFEIRNRKEQMGLEGGGTRNRPGRIAENCVINMIELNREKEEEIEDEC